MAARGQVKDERGFKAFRTKCLTLVVVPSLGRKCMSSVACGAWGEARCARTAQAGQRSEVAERIGKHSRGAETQVER